MTLNKLLHKKMNKLFKTINLKLMGLLYVIHNRMSIVYGMYLL